MPSRTPSRLAALVERWTPSLVILMPVLAMLGPYASLMPGRSGFPYFYRIVWLLLAIPAVLQFLTREVRREKIVWAFTAIAATWGIWAPLTALWAPGGLHEALGVIAPLAAALGAWVALVMSRGDRRVLEGMRLSWIVGLVCAFVVVAFEVLSGQHLVSIFRQGRFHFVNVWTTGIRHNPNDFAMVAGTGVIAVAMTLLRSRKLSTQIACFVLLLGSAYLTVSCNSRFAMLTYMIVVGLALLWSLRPRMLKTLVPYLLAAVLFSYPLVNGYVPGVGGTVKKAITTQSLALSKGAPKPPPEATDGGDQTVDGDPVLEDPETEAKAEKLSDNKRVTLTKLGVRFLMTAPITGHGIGAWEYLQPRDSHSPYWWPESLHNSFLQMGLELGAIGLLALVVTFLLLAWLLLRPRSLVRMWRDPLRLEAVCFTILVLIFSVAGSTVTGDGVFWLALGYACALAWAARRTDDVEVPAAAEGHGSHIR